MPSESAAAFRTQHASLPLTLELNLFCWSALRPGSVVSAILDLRPLRQLGRISYGAYVYHDILHGLISHAVLHVSRYSAFTLRYHGTITLLLALLATICLAELSFRFLETAFLKSPGTLGTAPFRVRIRAPAAA